MKRGTRRILGGELETKHPAGELRRVEHAQLVRLSLAVEPDALPAHDRRVEQRELVDQAGVEQRLHERRAAPDQQVLLLAQLTYALDVRDDRRVVPLRGLERVRD